MGHFILSFTISHKQVHTHIHIYIYICRACMIENKKRIFAIYCIHTKIKTKRTKKKLQMIEKEKKQIFIYLSHSSV